MLINATPTFDRVANASDRIVCLRGGTRSGKSYAMMQKVALWLWSGHISGKRITKGVFSVTRSTMPALKATVLSDFVSYLFELGIYQYVTHIKTTHEFIFKGRKVVFFSLDDEHKLRGRQHDFLWVNEVTDTPFEVFNQGIMRLNYQMFLDYNPQGMPWVRTEIEEKRLADKGDVHLDISVFTDNPYLPDLLIDEIRHLEKVDNDLFRIYTKGEWVQLKGLIYPNVKLIDEQTMDMVSLAGKVTYGMDFGYNDPSVLVKTVLLGENIYVDCLVYQRELLVNDMADIIRKQIRPDDVVYCDYAEPRTIEELRRRGVNAKKSAAKDVLRSIGFIKQHYIHLTSRSVDSQKEWEAYKWEEDKEGRLTDKPVNAFKHTSDAVSYSIGYALKGKMRLL